MSVPSNTFTTFDAVGNREDLIDVIENISPVTNIFTNLTGSGKANGRYHEFQTDALASPGANAVVEGDDAIATAITPTARLGNWVQGLRKVFQVSDVQEWVDKAGKESEVSHQSEKNLKELANDTEYALVINATASSGSATTARTMLGLDGYISTNVTNAGSVALTQAIFETNLQLIWAQGGFPSLVLCGAFQKKKFDALTTNTREVMADKKEVTAAIDVFKSSFGTVMIKLHHIINTIAPSKVFILGDMKLWKKAWLSPVKKEELARTGASRKFMIEAHLTLEGRQEKGSGKITNLTTS